MTRFPTLPANSCHEGPQPPTAGRRGFLASDIFRDAGNRPPDAIMRRCLFAASLEMRLDADPDRDEAVRWLIHHAMQWAALAASTAKMARAA